MPRTASGNYKGLFATYEGSSGPAGIDDEEAIAGAADEMFSMCGNAGQEALIGDFLSDFEDWAYTVLETEDSSKDNWEAFAEEVHMNWYDGDTEKWQGTELIWRRGYVMVAANYGHHDTRDEYGEGTGR